MNVDIWFDFICPFSYLGKKRFERALNEFKHKKDVKVVYHNFCIAPYINESLKMNAHQYLSFHKDISYDEAEEFHNHLTNVFKNENIDVDFEKLIPTTSIKAHQILKLITDKDQVNAYIDYVFKAHFEEGKDISSLEVLVEIGNNIGLNEDDVRAVYNTDMYYELVKNDYEITKDLGLNGVPAFVINSKYFLLGGQPLNAFKEMLSNLYEKEKNKPETEFCDGNAC